MKAWMTSTSVLSPKGKSQSPTPGCFYSTPLVRISIVCNLQTIKNLFTIQRINISKSQRQDPVKWKSPTPKVHGAPHLAYQWPQKNISDCYFIYRSWLCAWYCMWAGDNYLYHQVGLWVAPLLLSASSVTVNTGKLDKKMACEDFTRPFFSQASFVPHSKDSAKEGLLIVYHQGHCLSEISWQVRTNHPHVGVYDMLSSHVWLPHNM